MVLLIGLTFGNNQSSNYSCPHGQSRPVIRVPRSHLLICFMGATYTFTQLSVTPNLVDKSVSGGVCYVAPIANYVAVVSGLRIRLEWEHLKIDGDDAESVSIGALWQF